MELLQEYLVRIQVLEDLAEPHQCNIDQEVARLEHEGALLLQDVLLVVFDVLLLELLVCRLHIDLFYLRGGDRFLIS